MEGPESSPPKMSYNTISRENRGGTMQLDTGDAWEKGYRLL